MKKQGVLTRVLPPNLEAIRQLGTGTHGLVFQARDHATGWVVSIHILSDGDRKPYANRYHPGGDRMVLYGIAGAWLQ